MRLRVKITGTSTLAIRKGAGTAHAIVGSLSKDTQVVVTQLSNSFYKLEDGRGWIGKKFTQLVSNLETAKTPGKTDTSAQKVTTNSATTTKKSQGLDAKIINMLYEESKKTPDRLTASTRLFGSPHQFTPETDFRIGTGDYGLGRKYMESIITEAPIVYFLPGKPNYLPDLTEKEREGLKSFMLSNKNGDNQKLIDKILGNNESRYFGFLADYASYMRYVNLLCRFSAVYMGIGDTRAINTSKTPYKYYDWANYRYENTYKQKQSKDTSFFNFAELKTDAYEALFGNYQYVQFFAEPNTSFSESANNNTAESKMASAFDSAEGIVKELPFLTNTMAVKNVDAMKDSFATGMNDIQEKMLANGNENFFSRLMGLSSKVLSGSNVIFPQIWGDAAYNKSYNINIKLVSPYGSKEAIYLNIIVPLMHLLALALPRQTTANSYASPFLVKAFAKGWFSCEMGIIDSISIDKGGDKSWSVHSLPTEVNVQIGIKDLYSNLMVTPNSSPDLFFQNSGMIDFLAVTCGVDITKPRYATQLDALFAMLFSSVKDIPANWYRDAQQSLRNSIEGLFRL